METDAWMESRTVVVSGVPDVLPVSRMTDKLTIHFQRRRRSDGGDVEAVRYPTNMDGVAFVTFDKAADAERVVRRERQIMADDEFPEHYLLTVFAFTRDVYFYIPSATVDLFVFGGDQTSLIESLRSRHRSIRFRPLLQHRKATIEGPFTAIQALREDLICRAARLKSTVSARTAATKLKEAPRNPRVISHHEFVGSVSRGGSKAEPEPASSNGLSPPLQTTGEAAEVQSLFSNAKTQNTSSRQKVSRGSFGAGSFSSTDSDEEEQGARSKHRTPTEYRTERAKANPRQVLGEEINAGIRPPLSGLERLPAVGTSAKQPREDDISQKHTRADRISASEIRGETHWGSRYSGTDYLKESGQSSSAGTTKLLQTRLKDVSRSSESNTKDAQELPAARPEHPEDTCVWVDSYTFRYIQKFDNKQLRWCLSGLDASTQCAEGSDLMRITLTEKRTSKTASRMQRALEDLSDLVDLQHLLLRVHQICYDEEELQKQELVEICDDVNSVLKDVLYMFEGSCIKIVGPSISSHLFYKRVEDRIAKLKGNHNPNPWHCGSWSKNN